MNYLDIFIYSERRVIRVLRHVLFWATDFLSYLVFLSDAPVTTTAVLSLFSRLPLIAGVVYLILYYLIPKYSKEKHKRGLLIWTFGILMFIGIGFRLYGFYIVNPLIEKDSGPLNLLDASRIVRELLSWMGVVMLAVAIKLMKTKNQLERRNEELVREKRIAELSFLKAQMHPHFLFNTLNTLYSDAIKTNSKSEQIVLHLSSLMRFILEECNRPLIPLEKEIKVIDDYIALERLRHGARLRVEWHCSNIVPNVYISPLLLLPFVENSFKHTLSSQRGEIFIRIRLESNERHVSLYVENDRTPPASLQEELTGMGIKNTRRQLELLFDRNFTLDIQSTDKYIVHLKVPSSSFYG